MSTVDHGQRDHATWSASSTARNWHCAGALAMAQHAPPDVENIHSATGTAAHQVAEKCLHLGRDAVEFLGTVEKTKTTEIAIDEDVVESVQTYVDYVRRRLTAYHDATGERATLWVEQRFSFEDLAPPFDAGGTGDAVIHFPLWRFLEVVDLKNGRGIVEAEGNKQLRSYGLGAALKFPGLDVQRVMVTIVQPRVAHKDGRIRSDMFHIADLIDWTVDLIAAMRRSREAFDTFPGFGTGGFEAWWSTWLRPGSCEWCRASAICPALRAEVDALGAATVEKWFEDPAAARTAVVPVGISAGDLNLLLNKLDMVEEWAASVRAYAHRLAENNVEFVDWLLVDKDGRRKWKGIAADDGETTVAAAIAEATGLSDEEMFSRELKSPAQIEKVLRTKARKLLIADLWEAKSSGTKLVQRATSDKPPALTVADKYFEAQPGE